jgi:hypothetical protein
MSRAILYLAFTFGMHYVCALLGLNVGVVTIFLQAFYNPIERIVIVIEQYNLRLEG